MTQKPFGIFCPTSKALEVLEPKWTIQILGEMWEGATRFNEIRRGLPNLSPSLLSRRLKEMQENGLIERVEDKATGSVDYFRTQMAIDFEPIQHAMALWAQKHVAAEVALADKNADVLMWVLRKRIDVDRMPRKRNVLRFHFADADGPFDTYWVLTKPGEPPEVCSHDPQFDVDLFIETDVATLTGIYLGRMRAARAIDSGRLFLSGDARLERGFDQWLRLSQYANAPDIRQLEV